MDWMCLFFVIIALLQLIEAEHKEINIRELLKTALRRLRSNVKGRETPKLYLGRHRKNALIGTPQDPSGLPKAEPMKPGHTLIRPSLGMLKSQVQFPHSDKQRNAVYGNIQNLGVVNDKHEGLMYSSFRRENRARDMLNSLLSEKTRYRPTWITLRAPKSLDSKYGIFRILTRDEEMLENENNGSEIYDQFNPDVGNFFLQNRRRSSKRDRHRGRDSDQSFEINNNCTFDSSSSSTSADTEKNPGNPYTVFKNKYKQNFLWNHFMDGDHMNVNPYGPNLERAGPSGVAIFFGRKWWYFNQDDYKPFR